MSEVKAENKSELNKKLYFLIHSYKHAFLIIIDIKQRFPENVQVLLHKKDARDAMIGISLVTLVMSISEWSVKKSSRTLLSVSMTFFLVDCWY